MNNSIKISSNDQVLINRQIYKGELELFFGEHDRRRKTMVGRFRKRIRNRYRVI